MLKYTTGKARAMSASLLQRGVGKDPKINPPSPKAIAPNSHKDPTSSSEVNQGLAETHPTNNLFVLNPRISIRLD